MRLSLVIASVNNNPDYYMFIPKQILFWKKMDIMFLAIFVGDKIPDILDEYKDNIFLWTNNSDLHSAYVAQNIRMYIPAIIKLPPDEMCMITDMDMLPVKDTYYKTGLEKYNQDNFIYYREIDFPNKQIYMCYNAAHPSVWAKVFNITNSMDICARINENYQSTYNGIPEETGWFIDQEIMYNSLINYPGLVVLHRPIVRLEMFEYEHWMEKGIDNFIIHFDDIHFHRSYSKNEKYILDAERQLNVYQ
jgi:hypothetical protein